MEAAAEKSRSTTFQIFRHGPIIIYTRLPSGGTYYLICMSPTNSERLIGISDAFSAFVYGYPSSCPRAHSGCTPIKSVTTLRYTRRHGPIYTGHACRHLPSAVPWISEDRLLGCGESASATQLMYSATCSFISSGEQSLSVNRTGLFEKQGLVFSSVLFCVHRDRPQRPRYIGDMDDHLDFHTTPELWPVASSLCPQRLYGLLGTWTAQDFHTALEL